VDRWRAAEIRTNRMAAPAYAALDEGEREELAALLDAAAEVALARR
jgi:hypothetical protein